MKLLILGGTLFLGRHIVESALRDGHEVTLFNRGQHNPELFPEVEKLRGDRDGGLDALRGRSWDAVIDTCGFVPRVVRASAELLAGAVGLYVFISTISVYPDHSRPVDEDSPVGKLEDESREDYKGEAYGPLKALCERAVEEALPGRTLVVRPGLIVGPHDPTNRFAYWPRRVARGGEVLAPAPPERLVQFIDARDLADWTIRMAASGATGVFNATGPDYKLSMGALLEECRRVLGGDARFTWVDEEFLLENKVEAWSELPLWITGEDPAMRYFMEANCGRAFKAGLTFRPLAETVRDTFEWDESQAGRAPAPDDRPDATLKPERERELLEAWNKTKAAAGA